MKITEKMYYNFDEGTYLKAVDKYKIKLDLEAEIIKEYKIIGIKNKPSTFTKDEFEIQGGIAFSKLNPMKLTVEQYCNIKGIDFDTIMKLLDKYADLRHLKKPDKKDFHSLADTPEKVHRLFQVQEFIKVVEGFPYALNIYDILRAGRPCFFVRNNKLTVDANFINEA